GAEAIKVNQSEDPDLICMDMNMPVMDGLTALRNIVAMDRNVKVVMVTSLGGVGEKFTEAIKLGAKNVISKPFEAETVLQTLREA
ncbi:MAG: response regulator, partial [Geoalkalibacter sp.]